MTELFIPPEPVEYYYDLDIQKAVLLGGAALMGAMSSAHSDYVQELIDRKQLTVITDDETGAYNSGLPDDVLIAPARLNNMFPLARVLKDDEIGIAPAGTHIFGGISAERCIAFGKWIHEQATQYDNDSPLDIKLVKKAYKLGLGPSVKQLTDRFGNLTNFYAQLEIVKTLRKNQFDAWSDQKLIQYLASMGQAPNVLPRMRAINAMSKISVHNPSFNVFDKRFGGLYPAMELAGYWTIPTWDEQDYIEWGLQFALVNNRRLPLMREIYKLSTMGLGPASSNIAIRFGAISVFQNQIRARLEEYAIERSTMKKGVEYSEEYNPEIFNGSTACEESGVKQHARYTLINSLPGFTHLPYEIKVRLCSRTEGLDFIPMLANLNRSLSVPKIKKTARDLKVYSFVSSMDHHRNLLEAA